MRQYVYTLLVIIEIQVIWTIHKTLSQSSVPYRGLIKSNDYCTCKGCTNTAFPSPIGD